MRVIPEVTYKQRTSSMVVTFAVSGNVCVTDIQAIVPRAFEGDHQVIIIPDRRLQVTRYIMGISPELVVYPGDQVTCKSLDVSIRPQRGMPTRCQTMFAIVPMP